MTMNFVTSVPAKSAKRWQPEKVLDLVSVVLKDLWLKDNDL